jgi:transposase-like protein
MLFSRRHFTRRTRQLDAEIAEWRARPLDREYPYLVIAARYEQVRRGGSVVSQGVLVVVGIGADG